MKNFFNKLILNNGAIMNYRRMWPFIKPFWFRALLGVLITIPVGSLDAIIASFMKPLMDDALLGEQTDFLKYLPFIIVGFTVIQGILTYLASYINAWVGTKISLNVKTKLYDKLLNMDSSYFDSIDSGSITQQYYNDADSAANSLIDNVKLFFARFFTALSLIVVLLYNSWQLAIVAVGILVLAVHPVNLVRRKIKEISAKTVAAQAVFLKLYYETFGGNRVIHAYSLEDELRKRFEKSSQELFHLSIKKTQGTSWLSPVLHLIGSLGVAIVVGAGGHLIVTGAITPGNFVAFIAALIMLYTPLKSIGNNFVSIQLSFAAIERVFNLLDAEEHVRKDDGTAALDGIKEGIVFKDVSFGYVKGKNVLNGINLSFPAGKTTALVGNSGGGKTTISSLIPRLYDVAEGQILIDDVDIKDYTLHSLRDNIALVFQDNFLFSGTIRNNIALGNKGATDDMIWDALKNANLYDFVNSLKDKLDTEIGERGVLLSGGQKQRVAIARAFIKDAPLVILDEATSALDNVTEKVVQHALENLMKNRTVIVIAHRLSTVMNADNIIVINDGQVAEQGKHSELVALKGEYYSLQATQLIGDE